MRSSKFIDKKLKCLELELNWKYLVKHFLFLKFYDRILLVNNSNRVRRKFNEYNKNI